MTKRLDARRADLDALIAECVDGAVIHRRASGEGQSDVANLAFERLAVAFRELRTRGLEGQAAVVRLLEDTQIEVRVWAATYALEFAPERASAVLEEIASGPSSLDEFSAKMVLRQWRDGTFRAP